MRGGRLLALVLAIALSGCLRNAYNRCTEDPPHRECGILDSGVDTGVRADAPADAPTADAGAPVDGGVATDAPAPTDGGESGDAPAPDAASDAP